MKIVSRIRQLLASKPDYRAPKVIDAPLRAQSVPQETTSRVVEPPATSVHSERPPTSTTKHGFRLEGEGIAKAIPDPSPDIIRREIERLRTSGPSFVALVSPTDSYLQAAGNARRMTVEGHMVREKDTIHVVLGRQGPLGPQVTLRYSAGTIDVRAGEVWTASEVAELFIAFAVTGLIPPDLRSRDIAEELVSS